MSRPVMILAIALGFIMSAPAANAEIVWSEDFSDVYGWGIVYDPGGGSSITSSGGSGAFYVDKGNDQAAFAPLQSDANFIAFDSSKASGYRLDFTVDGLTWSTSYDIAMDEFNSQKQWLSTVWQVYPLQYTTTDTGSLSSSLGGFAWNPDVAYIIPKVNVHTGDPAQTVYFDKMSMALNAVPEPASTTLFFLGSGLFGFRMLRKRK